MKRTLLIAGALLLAMSSSSAFAQGYGPYYGGQSYYGRSGSYGDYARQLREERRHARVHRELDATHGEEHYQGLDSRADHHDLHDSVEEAHDASHYDRQRAGGYGGYGGYGNGNAGGYGGYGYGNGGGYGGYGGYGYGNAPGYGGGNYGGMSFGFGFRR